MPEYTVTQLYCRACGHELDGQIETWLPFGTGPRYQLWCIGCGWQLDGSEAKHEYQAALVELGADIPVGGLYA